MADVILTPTVAAQGGTPAVPSAMAVADTYIVRNSGRVVLHFVKTGAGAAVITITTPKQVSGLDVEEQTVNVPATTGDVWAGPFNPGTFNDASGDMRCVTDEDTGITIEAVQVG